MGVATNLFGNESKKILVALGGNAIKQADERGTAEEQFRNVRKTCEHLVKLLKRGYRLVITHGNGPQVGNLLIQQEEGEKLVPPQPLDILNAMTQGQIGYMIQQNLMKCIHEEGLNIPVTTVITQVLVRRDDPDFNDPSKPVGPFYCLEEAEELKRTKGYIIKKVKPGDGRVYRRVVPSPDPIKIVEAEVIRKMVDSGIVVIASGGGGIPVVMREDGSYEGVEAVIDKDLAGERLAEVVEPQIFLILTDVEKVKLNYGMPNEKEIDSMSLEEAMKYMEEGHFAPGSMRPKVQACIRFLKYGGKKAIITSLDKAVEAIEGKTGTIIYRNHDLL